MCLKWGLVLSQQQRQTSERVCVGWASYHVPLCLSSTVSLPPLHPSLSFIVPARLLKSVLYKYRKGTWWLINCLFMKKGKFNWQFTVCITDQHIISKKRLHIAHVYCPKYNMYVQHLCAYVCVFVCVCVYACLYHYQWLKQVGGSSNWSAACVAVHSRHVSRC